MREPTEQRRKMHPAEHSRPSRTPRSAFFDDGRHSAFVAKSEHVTVLEGLAVAMVMLCGGAIIFVAWWYGGFLPELARFFGG